MVYHGIIVFRYAYYRYTTIFLLPIGEIKPYFIIDNSLLFVLLGYELQLHQPKFLERKNSILLGSFLVFICANSLRFVLAFALLSKNIRNDHFLHIESMCSIFLSSKTFMIYLIHRGIYEKLNSLGIRDVFYFKSTDGFLYQIVSMLMYAMVVFSISIIIAWIIEKIVIDIRLLKK